MNMNAHTKKIIIGLVVLVVVLGFATFYFYKNYKSQSVNAGGEAEAKMLAKKVGKLIFLPTDEIPTIATVSDPEALKGQVFFEDAKKGDKVLMYTNKKKAILYDPIADKIITIAPLNIGSSSANTNPTIDLTPKSTTTKDGENNF